MASPIDRAIRSVTGDNRIVAAGLAGVGIFLGAQYWRRRTPDASAAPVVLQGTGDVSSAQLAAYIAQAGQQGAAAAASGFGAGADLGAAGFAQGSALGQTAIDVLGSSLGGAVSSLAGSQAAALGAGIDALANISLGVIGSLGLGSGTGSGGGQLGGGAGSGSPSGGSGGVGPPAVLPPPITTPAVIGPPLLGPPVATTPPTGAGPARTVATFRGPTTVYARHSDGHIGASKTFGQAGLQIRVNSVVVPRDSHGGGAFWEMKEGGAVGWLIRPSDSNVTFSTALPAVTAAFTPGGGLVPVGGSGPGNGPYTPGSLMGPPSDAYTGGPVPLETNAAEHYGGLIGGVVPGVGYVDQFGITPGWQNPLTQASEIYGQAAGGGPGIPALAARYFAGDQDLAARAVAGAAQSTADKNAQTLAAYAARGGLSAADVAYSALNPGR